MNEMTLSFRHRIRNSGPGGLRPSTLSLGHGGTINQKKNTKGLKKTEFILYKTVCSIHHFIAQKHAGSRLLGKAPTVIGV